MRCSLTVCVLIACLATIVRPTSTARILGVFSTPSRQQWHVHETLMRGLASKGHNITVISPYEASDNADFAAHGKPTTGNYRHVHVPIANIDALDLELLHRNLTNIQGEHNSTLHWAVHRVPLLLSSLLNVTADVLQSPEVERLKLTAGTEGFDVIVYGWFFNDFQLGLSGHFRCPSVLLSASVPAIQMLRDYVGQPYGVAYTPAMLSPFTSDMTFLQRMANYGLAAAELVATRAYGAFVMSAYYERVFGIGGADGPPSYAEVRENVSLVLLNQHFSEGYPMATMPGLVEVGGMTLNFVTEPLDEHIKHFLDSAIGGAVLLNFDASVQMSEQFDAIKIQSVMRVFERIPQLKLIVRWEADTLPPNTDQPTNVLVLPNVTSQNAILSHRNIRLFISSCDRRSLSEARFHGVPVLGVPLNQDQHQLLRPAMDEGWAMPMSFHYWGERSLHFGLDHMLNSSRYADNVAGAGLFGDREQPALETAVWWVEYVVRHGGAKHMQSRAVSLNWVQVNGLDVLAVVLVLLWLCWRVVRLMWWAIGAMLRMIVCRGRRQVTKKAKVE